LDAPPIPPAMASAMVGRRTRATANEANAMERVRILRLAVIAVVMGVKS
jgi:hypothetical protein